MDDISDFWLSLCERTRKLKEARRELWERGDSSRFSVYNPAEADVLLETASASIHRKEKSERCIVNGAEAVED